MTECLKLLFSLSLSGSVMVLLIWALKPLFTKYFSKTLYCYLWLIALLRFLIPYALPVNLMEMVFQEIQASEAVSPYQPDLNSSPEFFYDYDTEKVPSNSSSEVQQKTDDPPTFTSMLFSKDGIQFLLLLVWSGTAVVLFVKKTASYRSFLQFIKAGRKRVSDETMLALFEESKIKISLTKTVAVYEHPLISSPMLVGFFFPYVVIPKDEFTKQEAYYTFLHELSHLKRRDAFYKWCVQAAACLHWFNPFVYLMRHEISVYCEFSCDESVLHQLDAKEKRAYGDTLLTAASRGSGFSTSVLPMLLNADAKLIKERLRSIMGFQKKPAASLILSVFLSALLAAVSALCGFSGSSLEPDMNSTDQVYAPFMQTDILQKKEKQAAASGSEPAGSSHTFYYGTGYGQDKKKIYTKENHYSQRYFYEDSYILALAWNADTSKYSDILEVSLPGISYSLVFTGETAKYQNKPEIMNAVQKAVKEQRSRESENGISFSITAPILLEVTGPYPETPDRLARKFYESDELGYFSAVISQASQPVKSELAKKSCQKGKTGYFSMLADSLSQSEADSLAQIAYDNDETAIFSMLADKISNQKVSVIAQKACQNGKTSFFSMIVSKLSQADADALGQKAYDREETGIFSLLTEKMSQSKKSALAKKACEEGETSFFSMLVSSLSQTDADALAKKAYENDETGIFSMLVDRMSQQMIDKIAQMASIDGNASFFSMLSGSLSQSQADIYAQNAYDNDETSIFSMVVDRMSPEKKSALAKKACEEGETSFFSMLASSISQKDADALGQKAYDNGETGIFSIVASQMSKSKKSALAKKACQEGETSFFSVLASTLSQTDADVLGQMAYDYDEPGIFSMLVDKMSKTKKRVLSRQAYDEDNMSFYYMLGND